MQTIAEFKTPRENGTSPGSIVLRHNPDNEHEPWVTHNYNEDFDGYGNGHYFAEFGHGWADFIKRCQQWVEQHGWVYNYDAKSAN